MFTPEQVKKFILHPDPVVCNTALSFFSESFLYENDDTLMPLVLERLRQSNGGKNIHLFHAYRFPQTEATFNELFELTQSPHIDIQIKYHLFQMLWYSELQVQDPSVKLVIEKDRHWRKCMQSKMEIANMDDRELVDAFQRFIKDCFGKYVNEIDSFYGDEIVRELSHRRSIDPDDVLEKLHSCHPDDEGYEIVYYTQLAGEMKLEAAIPLLCRYLGAKDDLLPEKAMDALVRIGTPNVVTTLAEQYYQAPEEYYRLYASGVFGRIKHPESEEALLTLLPSENNITYATKLANGLCELGSSKGSTLVQEMVDEGYDGGYLNLTQSFYAYCVISNTDHPKLHHWKLEFEAEERRLAKHQTEMNRMAENSSHQNFGKLAALNAKPYINTNKVGRNEPCPCGSGKKYKKCCGK